MLSLPTLAVTAALLALGVDAGPEQSPRPTTPPDCSSRYQRQIDDGLSAAEIDSIERDTRKHSMDPIIAMSFERREHSGLVNHSVVKVKVLGRCDETSAGGRLFFFRRLKGEWRFDRKRDGRWASATQVVH